MLFFAGRGNEALYLVPPRPHDDVVLLTLRMWPSLLESIFRSSLKGQTDKQGKLSLRPPATVRQVAKACWLCETEKKNKSTAVVTFIRGFNFLRILFRLIEISQRPWWPLYCWSYVKGRKIETHMYHSWAGQYSCSWGQWISYPHYCFMECRDFKGEFH